MLLPGQLTPFSGRELEIEKGIILNPQKLRKSRVDDWPLINLTICCCSLSPPPPSFLLSSTQSYFISGSLSHTKCHACVCVCVCMVWCMVVSCSGFLVNCCVYYAPLETMECLYTLHKCMMSILRALPCPALCIHSVKVVAIQLLLHQLSHFQNLNALHWITASFLWHMHVFLWCSMYADISGSVFMRWASSSMGTKTPQ